MKNNTLDTDTLTATQARNYAKRILAECSQCFKQVKATRSMFGNGWEIQINGGRAACYGRTIKDQDVAEWTLETFKNDSVTA
jgi:hypothetical protein